MSVDLSMAAQALGIFLTEWVWFKKNGDVIRELTGHPAIQGMALERVKRLDVHREDLLFAANYLIVISPALQMDNESLIPLRNIARAAKAARDYAVYGTSSERDSIVAAANLTLSSVTSIDLENLAERFGIALAIRSPGQIAQVAVAPPMGPRWLVKELAGKLAMDEKTLRKYTIAAGHPKRLPKHFRFTDQEATRIAGMVSLESKAPTKHRKAATEFIQELSGSGNQHGISTEIAPKTEKRPETRK